VTSVNWGPDDVAFVEQLRARGIDVGVRKSGRPFVWPVAAWADGLTDAERQFFREHHAALAAMVRAKVLRDFDVWWQPPTEPVTAAPTAPEPEPEPVCRYCGGPCVGPEHHAYRTLHWHDPYEVARREAEATATFRWRYL